MTDFIVKFCRPAPCGLDTLGHYIAGIRPFKALDKREGAIFQNLETPSLKIYIGGISLWSTWYGKSVSTAKK